MQQNLVALTILTSFLMVCTDAYLQPGDKVHCTEPNGTSLSPSKFVDIEIGTSKCIKCSCENSDVRCNLAANCNPSQQQASGNNNDHEIVQTQTETPATVAITTTTPAPRIKAQTKKPLIGMRITLSPTPRPRPSTTEEPFQYADELEEEPADTDTEDVEEKPAEDVVPSKPSTTTTTTTTTTTPQPPKRQPTGSRYNYSYQTYSTSTQPPTRAPPPSQPQISSRFSSQPASRVYASQRVPSPEITPPAQSRIPISAIAPQRKAVAPLQTLDSQDEDLKSVNELGSVNRLAETYKKAEYPVDLPNQKFYRTPEAAREPMQDVLAEPVTDEIPMIHNWGKDNLYKIVMLFAVAAVLTSCSFVLCAIVYCAVQIFGKSKKQLSKPVQAAPRTPISLVGRTLDYNFDF